MTLPPATLHPLLAFRSSPAAFDGSHQATDEQVAALLEAARWAPSAGNSQPWAFIVGRRGEETHGRLARHLAKSSARWALHASLLVANLAHRHVEDTDWEYSEFWLYDLGQAVAHMTLQGEALGLAARQFRAFDREALHVEFDVPSHWHLSTITAFGVAAAPPPAEGVEAASRDRRATDDLLWPVSD